MKAVLAVLGGFATAFGVAWLFHNRQGASEFASDAADSATRDAAFLQQQSGLDLNDCSREELLVIGLSEDYADRVMENRPYRNRLDLISRMVVPEDVYETMKHSVRVDDQDANEPIKVAS